MNGHCLLPPWTSPVPSLKNRLITWTAPLWLDDSGAKLLGGVGLGGWLKTAVAREIRKDDPPRFRCSQGRLPTEDRQDDAQRSRVVGQEVDRVFVVVCRLFWPAGSAR